MAARAYNSNTRQTKTDGLAHAMTIRPARALEKDSTFIKFFGILTAFSKRGNWRVINMTIC